MIEIGKLVVGDQLSSVGPIKNIQLVIDAEAVQAATGQDVFGGRYLGQIMTLGTAQDMDRAASPGPISDCSAEIKGQAAGTGLKSMIQSYNSATMTHPQMLNVNNVNLLAGRAAGFYDGPRASGGNSARAKFVNCNASELTAAWMLLPHNSIRTTIGCYLVNCEHHGPNEVWGAIYYREPNASNTLCWAQVQGVNTRGIKCGVDAGAGTSTSAVLARVDYAYPKATTDIGIVVPIYSTGTRAEGLPNLYAMRLDEVSRSGVRTREWSETEFRR